MHTDGNPAYSNVLFLLLLILNNTAVTAAGNADVRVHT